MSEQKVQRFAEVLASIPESLREPYTLSQMIATSGYFPDIKSVSQAFTKLVFGKALGLSPLEAMTGIYFVKGRIALSASLMASLLRRSGRYDYRVLELSEERCTIRFFEIRGGHREELGDSTFTLEDARRAGLAEGENWKRYPRNMLFARALSNGVRWFCPDVLGGPIYEVSEIVESAPEEGIIDIAPQEESAETPKEPALSEQESPPSVLPQWDWTAFWSEVRRMGLTTTEAIRFLRELSGGRFQNFVEYARAGHTPEEALQMLRAAQTHTE